MTLERPLDDIERRLLGRPYVQVFEYQGRLDHRAVREAVDLLGKKYPVLRGRIRSAGEVAILHVPGDEALLDLEFAAEGSAALDAFAADSWDPSRALAKVLVIDEGESGYLALRADHAIIDGPSWVSMFKDLWSYYGAVVAADTVPVPESTPLPLSPQALFRDRWRPYPTKPGSASAQPVAADNRRFRLTKDETARIIGAARHHNTTVHALLCGAILKAQRRFSVNGVGPATMACWSVVNMRTRVTPTVGPTETANFNGIHRAEVKVGTDTPLATIAEAIRSDFDAALARRDISPGAALVDVQTDVATTIEPRLAGVFITNAGKVEPFPNPPGIVITGRKSLQPPTIRTQVPIFRARTYDGNLNISASYPLDRFTSAEIDHLVAATEELMREIV